MRIVDKPSISVVVPLYNKRDDIQRALQSILGQTFDRFEVVVVDDGSTDGSSEIVRRIADARVRLIPQPNAGVSVARNRGIQESAADLIAFLDADDEWMPDFLATIVELHAAYPEAGVYGTAYERHAPDGAVYPVKLVDVPPSPWCGVLTNYFRAAMAEPPLWSSALAVPKAVFDDVGGFPPGVKLGEDLDMWMRIALKYPVAYSNTVHAIYHQEASNRAMQTYRCNDRLVMADTAREALTHGTVPQGVETDLREYVYMFQILTASECAKAGELGQARKTLRECRETAYFRKQWYWWRLWVSLPKPLFSVAWAAKRKIGMGT